MVNGNDLIEFEEQHLQTLEEDFLVQNQDRLMIWVLLDYELTDRFKETYKDLWDEFVMNQYDNYRT